MKRNDCPGAHDEDQYLLLQKLQLVLPIVPTWGSVELQLVVDGPNGHRRFDKTFTGKGVSMCPLGKCAFKGATKKAMTSVLNAIVQAASTDEFKAALGVS